VTARSDIRSEEFRIYIRSLNPVLKVIAVTCLAAAAGGAAPAVELAPATVKGAVSIQFPKGWAVNAGGGRSVAAAMAPKADKDTTGTFQASLSITQDAGNQINGAAQQALLARQIPGYKAVEQPTQVAINGMQGVYFGGTFKSGNVELRSRQYMFGMNNQVYTITFTSLNSVWGNYRPVVEASVGTLEVKK
jgi:hypothetical protein